MMQPNDEPGPEPADVLGRVGPMTRHAYIIKATPAEMDSLAWLASRYTSAEVLYKALELADERDLDDIPENEPVDWGLSEPEAWEYQDALEREDPSGFIPCLDYDSELGRSLIGLEIV